MLKFALIDPKAISKKAFESSDYVTHAHQFIKGLEENLRVIVDDKGNLIQQLKEQVCQLGNTGNKQKFISLFTQILVDHYGSSYKKKFILTDVTYAKQDCQSITKPFYNKLIFCCDTLIVSKESDRSLAYIPEAIDLSHYLDSNFEDERRANFRDGLHLDRFDRYQCQQIYNRCLQYCKFLYFYDPIIAQSALKKDKNGDTKEGNWKDFMNGINFIVESRRKSDPRSKPDTSIINVKIITQLWERDEINSEHRRIWQSMIDYIAKINSCNVELPGVS